MGLRRRVSLFSRYDRRVQIIVCVNLIGTSSTIVGPVIMRSPDPYVGASVVMINHKAGAVDSPIPKMLLTVTDAVLSKSSTQRSSTST